MKMNVMRPCIPVMKMQFVTTQLGHLSAFVNMVLKEMRHTVKVYSRCIYHYLNECRFVVLFVHALKVISFKKSSYFHLFETISLP